MTWLWYPGPEKLGKTRADVLADRQAKNPLGVGPLAAPTALASPNVTPSMPIEANTARVFLRISNSWNEVSLSAPGPGGRTVVKVPPMSCRRAGGGGPAAG